MSRQELHFFSPEQVAQHLDDALAIVRARELSPELEAALVPWAAEKLSAKQIVESVPQPLAVPAMAIPRGAHH